MLPTRSFRLARRALMTFVTYSSFVPLIETEDLRTAEGNLDTGKRPGFVFRDRELTVGPQRSPRRGMNLSTSIGQERSKLFQNFICGFPWQFADELGFSDAPIEILHLIGENDSRGL